MKSIILKPCFLKGASPESNKVVMNKKNSTFAVTLLDILALIAPTNRDICFMLFFFAHDCDALT
jgi:hypothetical protein